MDYCSGLLHKEINELLKTVAWKDIQPEGLRINLAERTETKLLRSLKTSLGEGKINSR